MNIALVDRGEVRLAAIGDGSTGDMYVCERRGGAWRLPDGANERLHVDVTSRLLSVDPRGGKPARLRRFGREFASRVAVMIDRNWDLRVFGTSLVLAYVASERLAGAVYAQDGLPVHFCAGLLWQKRLEGSLPTNRARGGLFTFRLSTRLR